jgi:gluconokinase
MPAIVVVMGVAGSGKTTVGRLLAATLHCRFVEGDALHPTVNVQKMSRGVPLTDADRAPWLEAIHSRLVAAVRRSDDVVVACSALKQSYRDVLSAGVPIIWVYLKGSPELIRSRVHRRTHHYMKTDMLESQFDALEEPSEAIIVDVLQEPVAIVEQIVGELQRRGVVDRPPV